MLERVDLFVGIQQGCISWGNMGWIIIGSVLVILIGGVGVTLVMMEQQEIINIFPENLLGVQEQGLLSVTSITYIDKNKTIIIEENGTELGRMTLKSHKTYDEILKVPTGKNATVIWYDFYNFKDASEGILNGVEFIDLREEIINSTQKQLDNQEFYFIPNPSFNKPLDKLYKFVTRDERGDWIDYNSVDIPKENITIGVQTDVTMGTFMDVVLNIDGNKLTRNALVNGVNSGFVSSAPSSDPLASTATLIAGRAWNMNDSAPATATTVTEMGFYLSSAVGEGATFELGIYETNVSDGLAGTLVGKGSGTVGAAEGWHVVSGLSIPVTAGTVYWLGIQVDSGFGNARFDTEAGADNWAELKTSQTQLTDPWGAATGPFVDFRISVYALWEAAAGDCWENSGAVLSIPSGCVFTTSGVEEI